MSCAESARWRWRSACGPRSSARASGSTSAPPAAGTGFVTAVTSGCDAALESAVGMIRDIAKEDRLSFRMATIRAEIGKAELKRRMAEMPLESLGPEGALAPETIDRCGPIVAQMGTEPFMKALDAGAEVIVAGRACDDAVFAALPVLRGFDPGLALHCGKILECAGLSAIPEDLDRQARVDHAGPWQRFRHVTLPLLGPVIVVTLLFRTIEALRVFDLVYVLTGGGPGGSTSSLSLQAYEALASGDFGQGSALSTVLFLAALALSIAYVRLSRFSEVLA